MKKNDIQSLDKIEGGGFWSGFCAGIGVADGVGSVVAGLAARGVITLASGPAAPAVAIGLGVASIGCAIYALS
jgi:hypothetical protein